MDGLPFCLRLGLGLATLFLSNTAADDVRPPGECSSIFLGSLSETSNAVHIPSTGVYDSLDGITYNNRRVYKHTSAPSSYIYFLQSGRTGQGYWAVGPEVGSEETEMAISDADINRPDVTQQQQRWRLWSNETETWSTVGHLKAVCVDAEFGPCTSGRLRMSGISPRNVLQHRRMGLYLLTNRTNDLRPVYKHEEQEEFLFYTTDAGGGKWIVGPQVGTATGGMFVPDFALRPEFVVQTWVVFAGRYFANDLGVRLTCQGIPRHEQSSSESEQHPQQPDNDGNTDEMEELPEVTWKNYGQQANVEDTATIEERLERVFPLGNRGRTRARGSDEDAENTAAGCDATCFHAGHCQQSDPEVYRCICPEHYFGVRCQIDVDCGQPPLVSGQQVVSTTGHYLLDVAFYRCPDNMILDGPAGVICQVDGTWTDPPKCLDGHHLLTPTHDESRRTLVALL